MIAGIGWQVLMPTLAIQPALVDQAIGHEDVQPLCQYGWRYHTQAALQFAELGTAHQQLANDEQGPLLAEYLSCLCYGAELAISLN